MNKFDNVPQNDGDSFLNFYSGVIVNPEYKPGDEGALSVYYDPLVLRHMEAEILDGTDIEAIEELFPDK